MVTGCTAGRMVWGWADDQEWNLREGQWVEQEMKLRPGKWVARGEVLWKREKDFEQPWLKES